MRKKRIPVFKKDQKLEVLTDKNCAVREFTADGISVGRCLHYVGNDNMCPRHGDVSAVQEKYVKTGQLTDDRTHRH
jgi:hypothetical protein